MAVLNALTPRTRRRHAHRSKPPTLVHLDRVSLRHPKGETALHDLSLRIRGGERWQVFCDDRRVRTSLLQCVAGLLPPASGAVTIRGHVSWPLGQAAGLSNKLSCGENSRFLAGIYGQPGRKEEHLDLIRQLCGFSSALWVEPLNQIDGVSKYRFRLALSLAFDFDLYVLDPSAFRNLRRQGGWTDLWQTTLDRCLRERAVISLGPDDLGVGELCRKGLVLEQGRVLAKGSLERCQTLLAERPRQRAAEA
jgi:capsular polysaccharide transport system ATP-binding protein